MNMVVRMVRATVFGLVLKQTICRFIVMRKTHAGIVVC